MSKARFFTRLSALAASSLLAAAIPAAAASSSFRGKVIDVNDGDTLVISSSGHVKVVQLAGIDAPELSQEYGVQARDFVREMTKGKKVQIDVVESKARQSVVARVTVDGKDLASALVEAGMAWSTEGGDNASLHNAQQKAKSDGQGLWASANPMPPWEYRKSA